MIDRARVDYGSARNLHRQHYYDMMGVSSRLHSDARIDFQEPKDFFCPGTTPPYARFRARTTYLNVAKMLCLEATYAGLEDLFAATMAGRTATSQINGMLGGELEDLLTYAQKGYVISMKEARRFRSRYDMRGHDQVVARICKNFISAKGCPHGNDCSHIHAVLEEHLDAADQIFCGFGG